MQRSPTSLLIQLVPDYFKDRIKIPPGQREGHIWTLEQKQNLIDSLYNDFDIPKIYFRLDPRHPDVWYLIDGQQRLESVREFLENKFSLSNDTTTLPPNVRGKYYRDLRPEDKSKVASRSLDVIIFQTEDESEEEDMFLRLNNGTPLNTAEKRNAIRGECRDTVKKLARHSFFKKVAFSSKRYAFDAVVSQLVAIILADGPTNLKGVALKKLYIEKKIFSEKRSVEKAVKHILSLLGRIFPKREPFLKRFYVTSLFVLLSRLEKNYALSSIPKNKILRFILNFEKMKAENSTKNEEDTNFKTDLLEFYEKSVNSPDSEEAVRKRHEILLKYFLTAFPNIPFKDPRRIFSNEQKVILYSLAGGFCAGINNFICPNKGKRVPFSNGEFDHIKEYSEGGLTTISNGRFLCLKCHAIKTVRTQKQNSS